MSKEIIIKAIINKVSLALAAFLLLQLAVEGQPAISMEQHTACADHNVEVAVMVNDFLDISSLTFNIHFDTQVLDYINVVNPHQELLNKGQFLYNYSNTGANHYIKITWIGSATASISIEADKLLGLEFFYKGGSSVLEFDESCEVSVDIETVDAVFLNGSLTPLQIIAQSQNQVVTENDQAQFHITINGSADYQWQYSSGSQWIDIADNTVYSGSDSPQLIIINASLGLDGNMYRCLITYGDCIITSESASLKVDPLGIIDHNKSSGFDAYPNPFSDRLYYTFSNTSVNISHIEMVNLLGKQVYRSDNMLQHKGSVKTIQTDDLQPGLYFLQLKSGDRVLYTMKVIKR